MALPGMPRPQQQTLHKVHANSKRHVTKARLTKLFGYHNALTPSKFTKQAKLPIHP